jgi:subfamily B ATP-binding cassette protein MsbA
MFFQNWKLSLVSIIMIPLASFFQKLLVKEWEKLLQAQEKSGFLTSYLVELFKNHKLIKIFQKEKYENQRANKHYG